MRHNPKYTIVTAMKNEGPYILDWVAHHMAIGFEHFIVLTNDCEDGTDYILERLQELGHVTTAINPKSLFRDAPSWQQVALSYAQYFNAYKDSQWLLYSDVDEYIELNPKIKNLDDLIEKMGQTDVISFTSIPYNSFGKVHFEDAPVNVRFHEINRYIRDDRETVGLKGEILTRSAVKTMTRNDVSFKTRRNHRPVDPEFSQSGRIWRNGSGQIMPPEFTDSISIKYVEFKGTTEMAQLGHYAIRTLDEFLVKADRGDAVDEARLGKSEHYFKNYDIRGEINPNHQHVPAKAEKIRAGFAKDPELGRLHQFACEWHKTRVETLIRTPSGHQLAQALGRNARMNKADPEGLKPHLKPIFMFMPGEPDKRLLLSILSYIKQNHPLTVLTTKPLETLPKEVLQENAFDILPAPFPLESENDFKIYENLLRIFTLTQGNRIWVGRGTYAFQPLYAPVDILLGAMVSPQEEKLVLDHVLHLPEHNEIFSEICTFLQSDTPPPFFAQERREKIAERIKEAGALDWRWFNEKVSGGILLHHFLKRTPYYDFAFPANAFNIPNFGRLERLTQPIGQMPTMDHLVNFFLPHRLVPILADQSYAENSVIDRILKTHDL